MKNLAWLRKIHFLSIKLLARKEIASLGYLSIFPSMLAEDIKTLSKSEKILMINDLWEDLSEEVEINPLSEEQNQLLDSRYEAFLATPDEGTPWSEVKKNLKELL